MKNILKKNQCFFLCLCIIVLFIILFIPKKEKETIDSFLLEEEITNKIFVDIKGAVQKPGVYEMDENSRVQDAIEKSGGLTKYADTSVINLSKQLTDEMVIIVYTESEIQEMKQGTTSIKYIEKECICPKLENNACIEESTKEENLSKVSLNHASLEELMTLPGIGKTKAEAIIQYRIDNNGFQTIEELKNVKGIGDATFEKLKAYIVL